MTPQELLERLVALFPDFRARWDDPGNCFRNDDGSFTLHGVFAEFTGFFRARHVALPVDRIAALGAFVSDCMAPADDGPLDNAAATCFVENIAGAVRPRTGAASDRGGQALLAGMGRSRRSRRCSRRRPRCWFLVTNASAAASAQA
jgi:hypothetical protein